jgi:hypothetical protein
MKAVVYHGPRQVPPRSVARAGGSGIGVINDDPGGGARCGVLAEALRGGGGSGLVLLNDTTMSVETTPNVSGIDTTLSVRRRGIGEVIRADAS